MAEARIRLETVEEIPELKVLELALSIQDKVNDYLEGLPGLQDVGATSNAEATQSTTSCDFAQAEPDQVASSRFVSSTKTLNPLATPWIGPPNFGVVGSKLSIISHAGPFR